MRLVPTQPPGRSTRKARGFDTEIVQLRAQGYTLQAIRDALASAGVHVSISTVRREANRSALPNFAGRASRDPTTVPTPATPLTAPVLAERRSGKEIAEVFMRNRITNPLIRSKEQR